MIPEQKVLDVTVKNTHKKKIKIKVTVVILLHHAKILVFDRKLLICRYCPINNANAFYYWVIFSMSIIRKVKLFQH
jgi:hypothetical protein